MDNYQDNAQHFADEFYDLGDKLKKMWTGHNYAKKYGITNNTELYVFISKELDEFRLAIEDILDE